MNNIIIITQSYPPEKFGNSSRIYDLSKHLSELGNKITVLCPFPSFPPKMFPRQWKLLSDETSGEIKIIRLWTWQPTSKDPIFFERLLYFTIFPFFALIYLMLTRKKFDFILTSSPPIFIHLPGIFFKLIYNTKWIVDVRDLWINASISLGFLKSGSLLEKISRKYENYCFSKAEIITVTTKEMGRRISYNETIAKKIRLISNGVEIDKFIPMKCKKKNQFVYSGLIGHAQNLDLVILAMKKIILYHDTSFLIVGEGDTESDLKNLVKIHNLQKKVIFVGPKQREEIPKIINESIFGIAPLKNMESLEYAAPTKVYEYMSCGIPFLGTGKGEIMNIAFDSKAGIIAENNIDSISSAILFFLNNKSQVEEMGKHGREYIVKSYDRKTIASKLNNYIGENYGSNV